MREAQIARYSRLSLALLGVVGLFACSEPTTPAENNRLSLKQSSGFLDMHSLLPGSLSTVHQRESGIPWTALPASADVGTTLLADRSDHVSNYAIAY
jgi:hypothetical protein